MTGVEKGQEQKYPGSRDRRHEGTGAEQCRFSGRRPEGSGAEARSIQVPVTGGQKDQEQKYQIPVVTGGQKEQEKKYPGFNDRRPEG